MTITILRPSTRILTPGARGIRYAQPGGGAAPWWMAAGVTPIAAYQAKGAASYAASKVNLAQPGTYDATEGVAPSWDAATGWSFLKTSAQYLLALVPYPGNQTYSAVVRFSDADTSNTNPIIASSETDTNMVIGNRWNPGVYLIGQGNSFITPAPALTAGVLGVAGRSCYLNGLSVGDVPAKIATNSSLVTFGRFFGIGYGTSSIHAVAIYSAALNAAQMAAVSAAMAAL